MATQTLPKRHIPKRLDRKHVAKRPPRRKPGKRHFLLRFWWLWAVPLLGVGVVVGALAYVYSKLPLNLNVRQEQTSYLYDRDGKLLTTFQAGVDRTAIDVEDMPEVFRLAVLAAEDEDFYTHSGVDVLAIFRAGWANLTGGRIEQGASTITQQYVRNVYPEVGTEVSIERKIKEVLLAIKLEQALPKDEILRRYLNTVYFGQGAYGVEAAAQTYFGIHAKKLDLLQSATLAGVISGPSLLNPIDNESEALGRRNWVLDRMVGQGFVGEAEVAPLRDNPIRTVRPPKGYEGLGSAYYIDYTRRYLEKRFGGKTFTGGLRVRGSLNSEWQEKAEQAVANHLSLEPGTPRAALVAIDVNNGEIRAMVGGKKFAGNQVNLATGDGGTGRQSGSAFKAFTLATAIDQGASIRSVFSGPGQIDLSERGCPGWEPANYSDSGFGTMDLVSATASSVNTIFAQLVVEVGPENVAELAHEMGIRSPLEVEGGAVPCSITLGTMEVTPLEMTEAFATFASGGVRHQATPVHQIKHPIRGVIRKNDNSGRRILEENEALQAIYAMRAVVSYGTGTAAYPGYPVFGKTGTTDDDSDVWFCGSSSEVAACVWVGHPEGRVSMPGATGGTVAAPIWHDFMVAIAPDIDPEPFPDPEITGDLLKPSPVPMPAPSVAPSPKKEEKEEEEKEEPKPKPSPKPTAPPPPPPTTPPPPPPPTEPPPTPTP